MDGIPDLAMRNPARLCRDLGGRLRAWRLQRGWTQEEMAQRAGVGLSTVKAIESRGRASFGRVVQVAVALGLDGEIRALFGPPERAESFEEIRRRERQRAPRKRKEDHGTAR